MAIGGKANTGAGFQPLSPCAAAPRRASAAFVKPDKNKTWAGKRGRPEKGGRKKGPGSISRSLKLSLAPFSAP
ncbi:MAG: hypothetical protein NT115_13435, partial [Proteobacteria bacterium]|nr:hypothetical protein [Pseudomonadota bacterium]